MSNGTQIGLVGFFDILGYQNLLERNEPEQIAAEVLPILLGLPDKVTRQLTDGLDSLAKTKHGKQTVSHIVSSMKLLSFSDTILMTLPVDQEKYQVIGWMIFLLAAGIVQVELFEAGLPTRSAIDYGKFFTKDTCFAGRTIVNSYQLSAQIEMSACVLSEAATEELRRIEQKCQDKRFEDFVFNYLVPLKEGERHMPVVRFIPTSITESNTHKLVMKAFWGNGKDISKSVHSKIMNTEQWFEFVMSRQKSKSSKVFPLLSY